MFTLKKWNSPLNDIVLFAEIAKPVTTRRPNSRRDSKKSWKVDYGHEKHSAGIKDLAALTEEDMSEETNDFPSATASSNYFNFAMSTIAAIMLLRLST